MLSLLWEIPKPGRQSLYWKWTLKTNCHNTAQSYYNTAEYNLMMHATKRWRRWNINQTLGSLTAPHILASLLHYRALFQYKDNISRCGDSHGCWLSGKLWYLQHNCVGDTIVYHYISEMARRLSCLIMGIPVLVKMASLYWNGPCVYFVSWSNLAVL